MPSWDDEYDTPNSWSATEHDLFDSLVGGDAEIGQDQHLQALYDSALFSGHDGEGIHGNGGREHDFLLQELEDYLLSEYGIDFSDTFDWDAYDRWYEG